MSFQIISRQMPSGGIADGANVACAWTRRLRNAAGEMSHWREYDYIIINQDIESSAMELGAILRTTHLRTSLLTKESWNEEI